MSAEGIFFYIFAMISTLYIVHFGFYLVGANFYDVWQLKRRKRLWKLADRLEWPLITVLVPAHNEEKVIHRTLESIRTSSYPKIQIIVVDDASTDRTREVVEEYIKENPSLTLQVVTMPKNSGKGAALNYALENFTKGEFVMTLDADSMLSKDAISCAISYFVDPTIVGVAANVQIIEEYTVLGMLQKFEHMIGYRSKKTYSLFNCEFVIGGVASTYRMSTLRAVGFYDTDTLTEDIGLSMKIVAQGNKENRIVYGADIAAITEGVTNFRALAKQRYRWKYGSFQNLIKYRNMTGSMDTRYTAILTFYRMPMAFISEFALLCAPIVWLFTLYVTFSEMSLWLVIGAYMTITIYTLITIWFDEHCTLRDRWRLSAYALIAYFMFYVMDVIQFIAIIRCMIRAYHLITQKNSGSTWVSPQRVGKEIFTEESRPI